MSVVRLPIISNHYLAYTCPKEQQKLDTAIDEGGPSRQFMNDTFLQMQTLAVPVRGSGKSILLFHQAEAGEKRGRVIDLVPRRDDELEWEVMKIVQPRCTEPVSPEIEVLVEETMTRVKEYSRVMGRMLLHAFICGHPVLSACMTPFYMNCKKYCFVVVCCRLISDISLFNCSNSSWGRAE